MTSARFSYVRLLAIATILSWPGLSALCQEPQNEPDVEVLPVPRARADADASQPFNNDPSIALPAPTVRSTPGAPGDWRAAAPGREQVSEVIRAHWVSLDRNGQLVGRVSVIDPDRPQLQPVEGLVIRFLREGQTLARTETDGNGRFTASGLQPGVFTLVASGPRGFMAYTLTVISFAEAQRQAAISRDPYRLVQLGQIEAELAIDAAAVPPTFNNLNRIVRRYYPDIRIQSVSDRGFQRVIAADNAEQAPGAEEAAGPERRRGISELEMKKPVAQVATSIRQHEVQLLPEGRMLGRLHGIDQLSGRPKLITDVNVFLLRDDRLIDQVSVNELGIFEIRNLEPGSYGLVAAGQNGFGAVGVRLVRGEVPMNAWQRRSRDLFGFANHQRRDLATRLVDLRPVAANDPTSFSMSVTDDPRNVNAAFAPTQQQAGQQENMQAANAPMNGNVGPGGGGGSGAAGGFASGAGSLLGLASLAGLAGLGGINDQVQVSSPFSPAPLTNMVPGTNLSPTMPDTPPTESIPGDEGTN